MVNTGVRFNDLSAYRSEVAMIDNTRAPRSINPSPRRNPGVATGIGVEQQDL